MDKKILKIGQEIEVQEDISIKTFIGGKFIKVNKGDIGIIDSKKFIHLLSGESMGKILKMSNVKLEGFDYNNISKIILNNLLVNTGIKEAMEDYCISEEVIKEYIEDTLREII